MAGKEVTAKQVWMVKSLLRTRQVSAANVAEANLLLGASLSSGAGRDVVFIIIHQLLHRPTRGDYRKSYLS